jgi:hypothetical protein
MSRVVALRLQPCVRNGYRVLAASQRATNRRKRNDAFLCPPWSYNFKIQTILKLHSIFKKVLNFSHVRCLFFATMTVVIFADDTIPYFCIKSSSSRRTTLPLPRLSFSISPLDRLIFNSTCFSIAILFA